MHRIAAIFILATFLLLLSSPISLADQSWRMGDLPTICSECSYQCTVKVAAATASQVTGYPGGTVTVPVDIWIPAGKTIQHIWVRVRPDAGLTLDSFDFSETEWQGTIDTSACEDTIVDFQLYNDTLTQDASPGYRHLLDLIMKFAGSVPFSASKKITYDSFFPIVQDTGGLLCTARGVGDTTYTITGRVWLNIDTTLAYSYQALDSVHDPEKYDLVDLPIYYKANFPADTMKFTIKASDGLSLTQYHGFVPNPSYNAQVTHLSTLFTLWDYSSLYPVDQEILLGTLQFYGRDYLTSYSNNYAFTVFDSLYLFNYQNPRVHLVNSSQNVPFDTLAKYDTTGGLQYPVYSCTTSMANANVNLDQTVQVPFYADHSFPSQAYHYYIRFNNRCLTLDDVFVPPGDTHQSITYSFEDSRGDTTWYEIYAQPLYNNGKYVAVDSHDNIFTADFTASDSFAQTEGDTTYVRFDRTRYHSWIWDYYEPDGFKIERKDTSATYFKLNNSKVTAPRYFAVSIDSITDIITQDTVRVDRVTSNYYDSLYFRIDCPDTGYAWILDFTFGSDYDFDNTHVSVGPAGTYVNIYAGMRTGEIDGKGTIGYITYKKKEGVSGFARLQWHSFELHSMLGTSFPTQEIPGGIRVKPKGLMLQSGIIPDKYLLDQNYPNPFNAETIIKFGLPEDSDVDIAIYDLLGRRARSLLSAFCSAGKYEVTWNGRDDYGRQLTSGVYLYVLRTNGHYESKKMLMLK